MNQFNLFATVVACVFSLQCAIAQEPETVAIRHACGGGPAYDCLMYSNESKPAQANISILNCPTALVTFSDTSTNHPDLYNDPLVVHAQTMSTDQCEGEVSLSVSATSSCAVTDLLVSYQLFLDLDGDGNVESLVSSADAPIFGVIKYANIGSGGIGIALDSDYDQDGFLVAFGIKETIQNGAKTAQLVFKTQPQYADPAAGVLPQMPNGKHYVIWTFTDPVCNATATCTIDFEVKDTKAPVIVCKPITSVFWSSPTGQQVIEADILAETYSDNCNIASELQLEVCRLCDTFPTSNTGISGSYRLTPCDLGSYKLRVWVKDQAGNVSSCETNFFLIPDGTVDNFPVHLQGLVYEAKDSTFCPRRNFSFDMRITGTPYYQPSVDTTVVATTNQTGRYIAASYPGCSQMLSFPTKTDEILRGVDVLDIRALRAHFLGTTPLPNPYRTIAADVNNTGSITSMDELVLLRVLLGIAPTFGRPSYLFIDRNVVFPNPNNPFVPIINSWLDPQQNYSIVAVKVGDLTDPLNCDTAAFVPDTACIYITDQMLVPDQIFEVDLAFPGAFIGFQGTFKYAGLELVEVIPLAYPPSQYAQFPSNDLLTFAWLGENSSNFKLKFKALTAGKLSDFLRLNSDITPNVCYLDDRIQRVMQLKFVGSGTTDFAQDVLKMSIAPNPFSQAATVQFHLPKAGKVQVTVLDMLGRQVYQAPAAQYVQGTNAVQIQAADLGQSGVYQLVLSTETASQTEVMVLQR
jgi:Secretion system C-terminal sorting domain